MTRGYDIDTLVARLGSIKHERNAELVRQKSRDFYWYSPVLKRQLEAVAADIVVTPANEAEAAHVLAQCFDLSIPVTARGGGTGNYGQAMPLSGGVVLSLTGLDQLRLVERGRVAAGAGALMADVDAAARAKCDRELRIHPTTWKTATIGGFIAGGSGGIGSITWGGLRDFGNILRLRVLTMEAAPRVLELTGEALHKVSHAYGTNGLVTEVEMPLTAATDWVEIIVGFDRFQDAAGYANGLGRQDGILKKLLSVIAAPSPHDYFLRHRKFLRREASVVLAMIAPESVDALLAFTRRTRGAEVVFRSDTATADERKGLPPVYELSWNHTTLRALRVDPAITYLQVLYPFPGQLELIERIHARLGEEVRAHLEFARFDGDVTCFGLPLVRFSGEARLDEIIRIHEDMGAPIFNPHRYTLEEGGMKRTDEVQLAFKREADPKGLLNPGKMLAWENPAFDYRSGKVFLFPGLASAG